jgi:hypothetical protein
MFSNDSNGIRMHRILFEGDTVTFVPPMKYADATGSLGQQVDSAGTAQFNTVDSGNFTVNYTATSTFEAVELVTVPMSEFVAAKLVTTLRLFGTVSGDPVDETSTQTMWLAESIGVVKSAETGEQTYELISVSDGGSGQVSATLTPAEAADAGGRWKITSVTGFDSGWQTSGTVLTGITAGRYTLSFQALPGWLPPPPMPVDISSARAVSASGEYTRQEGDVVVMLEPVDVTLGRWRLTGPAGFDSGWQSSGARLRNVPVADYTLEFSDVGGWNKPLDRSVTITAGALARETASYSRQIGGLAVYIMPQGAVDAGAQWRIHPLDPSYHESGTILAGIPVGTYEIEFKTIDSWIAPSNQQIVIVSDVETTVESEYLADMDRDDMSDIWEQQIIDADPNDSFDTLESVVSNDDLDEDGRSNLDEFLAGTDPLVPEVTIRLDAGWNLVSVPSKVIDPTISGVFGDTVAIVWEWRDGRFYRVHSNDELSDIRGYWAYAAVPATVYVAVGGD